MACVPYNRHSTHYYRAVCLIVFMWRSWSLLVAMVTAGLPAVTAFRVVIICSRKVKIKDEYLVASNGIMQIRNFSKIGPAAI